MATYKIYKETALPGTLQANSIYLIAPAAQPNYLEIYVTNNAGTAQRRIPTQADIQALIDASVGSLSGVVVVANIAERNALTLTANTQVLVIDASADSTVASGSATYIYKVDTTSFIKISEAESMDLVINWSAIVGKPSSSVAAIDDAVNKAHAHTNKTQLDKISENGDGQLVYNSQEYTISGSTSW